MATIKALQNGPYVIDGDDVVVVDHNDKQTAVAQRPFALCRCGATANGPFCDGTHAKIQFQSPTTQSTRT